MRVERGWCWMHLFVLKMVEREFLSLARWDARLCCAELFS